jgi:hypothetical protein
MKFQVEEDAGAKLAQSLDHRRAFGREELAAHFEHPGSSAEPFRQSQGRPRAVNIQGNDQLRCF